MRRDPSVPSEIKSQTKSYCVRILLLYMRCLCEQAHSCADTTKATQLSGFVCDFASLVGVDGFECRAVAFATARHHRRGSAVKLAWCANNRGGNVAKKLLHVISEGEARANRLLILTSVKSQNRRQAFACFFVCVCFGSLLTKTDINKKTRH